MVSGIPLSEAIEEFLASCRTVAEVPGRPDFFQTAQEVAKTLATP
jgi:hypothetical protein